MHLAFVQSNTCFDNTQFKMLLVPTVKISTKKQTNSNFSFANSLYCSDIQAQVQRCQLCAPAILNNHAQCAAPPASAQQYYLGRCHTHYLTL